MIFVNTRPSERAQKLSDHLRQHGIEVVDLPLLQLLPCSHDLTPFNDLLLGRYTVVVVVSELAAKQGIDHLARCDGDKTELSHIAFMVVGKKTAHYLQHYAYQQLSINLTCYYPADENNEGMLALPLLQQLTAQSQVQVWRGVGGREVLIKALQARGVSIVSLNLYSRVLPNTASTQFGSLIFYINAYSSPTIVLISSLTAWRHWQSLLKTYEHEAKAFSYLVLQARIANLMREQTDANIIVIADLQPTTVLAALANMA